MPEANLSIAFEMPDRAYDADHPIIGTVKIETPRPIGAYGVQLKLELVDMSKVVNQNSESHNVMRRCKVTWERFELLTSFQDKICPAGTT